MKTSPKKFQRHNKEEAQKETKCMASLDELVTQIENPDLRARIAAEVEKLAKQ